MLAIAGTVAALPALADIGPWVALRDQSSITMRVPGPLGDRLVLRTLRESHGEAMAVDGLSVNARDWSR